MSIRLVIALVPLGLLAATASAHADSDWEGHACGECAYDTGRIGLGAAIGHEWRIDGPDGDQVGLLGSVRLTPSLSLEIELGKAEYENFATERRLGGYGSYQVTRLAWLAPFVVAGGGVAGPDDDAHTFLEAGGGIKFPIGRHAVLMLDVRSGRHFDAVSRPKGDYILLAGEAGSAQLVPLAQDIDYSRWRLVGMFYF